MSVYFMLRVFRALNRVNRYLDGRERNPSNEKAYQRAVRSYRP
jgi:hypothetical protein